MLVGLGLNAIRRAILEGRMGESMEHQHGSSRHRHHGPAEHMLVGAWTLARRPLVIGLVHGLAGSGALTALVLAELPDVLFRLIYILLFGLGSVVGMATLSGLAGWPLLRLSRSRHALRVLACSTGLCSTVIGLFWGYPLVLELAGLQFRDLGRRPADLHDLGRRSGDGTRVRVERAADMLGAVTGLLIAAAPRLGVAADGSGEPRLLLAALL